MKIITFHAFAQHIFLDGCIAIFRIYLHSHHVVPVVIFGSWTHPWTDVDIGHCDDSALYIADNLVRICY